jgi:hypothetical protein
MAMSVATRRQRPTIRVGRREAAEVLLVLLALGLYYFVRGLVIERIDDAVNHALWLIDLEHRLGIHWELALQAPLENRLWLTDLMNSIYLYGHMPLIAVLAVFIYMKRPAVYSLLRNSFLLSGGIGLVIFATYPVAPPRLLPDADYLDTIYLRYGVERVLWPEFFMNQYAAMPSLHFGWNLLTGIAVWMAFRHVAIRAFAAVMPALMFLSIVSTGNHFVIDAVAGGAVVVAGFSLALLARHLAIRYRERGGRRAPPLLMWLLGAGYDAEGPRRPGSEASAAAAPP